MASVFDLLDKVDNLGEPRPVLNSKEAIFGIVLSFLIFSSLCAFGRLWIRVFVARAPGWDDIFLALAVVTNIIQAVGLCLATNYGLGSHFLLLGYEGMSDFIRIFYIANVAYPMSTVFIKLAILFQYLRIFDQYTKSRLVTRVTIVVVTLWGLSYTYISLIPCVPVYAYWDWDIPDNEVVRYGFGTHDPDTFVWTYLGQVASNMVLDLIIFAIPLPLWMGKGIPVKTRTALLFLLILGVIVNFCSIFRVVTIAESRAGTYPTLDPSWYGCTPAILSALEVHIATICAALPIFWPFIQETLGMIMVTHEVNVTRETRAFSGFSSTDDGETHKLDTMTPQGGHYPDAEKYLRSQVDPLHVERPFETTVISGAQVQRPGLRVKRSLDVGANFAMSLVSLGQHSPTLEKQDSKEVLLPV